jgi:glycosyltransferase involved in cell wall biosynthesis
VSAPVVSALVLTRYPARAAMLEVALASLRQQTFRDAEAVIVNDGDPLACELPGMRVIVLNLASSSLGRRVRVGIGDKRNLGLRAARGEWVAIWDDDDVSLPSRLAESLHATDGGRAAYVKSSSMWVADAGLRVAALCAGCCYPTALVHRARALDAGGFGEGDYGEDAALFRRLVVDGGAPWRDLTLRSYVHRRHQENVSARVCGETMASFLSRAISTTAAERNAAQGLVDALVAATARAPALIRPL